jgi:hypothetical protein
VDRPSPPGALTRSRLNTIAVLSVVALGLAGCGHRSQSLPETSSPGSAVGHSSATRSSSAGSSGSSTNVSGRLTPRRAVLRFAQTYGEFLDGRRPAARVAEASTIDVGIRIAPNARTGRLHVAGVAPAPLGRPSGFVLRDRTHTIRFTVTIARVHDTFLVRSLTAPDLDSVVQGPPRAIVQPLGSAPARRAARRFLTGFLAWVYGYGKASAIVDAAPRLGRRLTGPSPARVSARSLDPRVVAIGMVRTRGGWTAEANVTDSQRTYALRLTLIAAGGGWALSDVRDPN